MPKAKEAVKKIYSPCEGCEKEERFSFNGCMRKCEKFFAHLKKAAVEKGSPCRNYRCGVPGVDNNHRTRCEKCPIREAYSKSLGKTLKGTQCKLGQEHTPYTPPWEYKYDPNVKH